MTGSWPLRLLVWGILVFMVLPALVVVPLSFSSVRYFVFPPPDWSVRWYANFLQSREWNDAVLVSLRLGVASTVLSLILGVITALLMVRTEFWGKALLYAVLMSPLVMPTIILAIGLYFIFAPLRLVGSEIAIILGHVVIGTPYVIVTVSAALERFDLNLERAALSLSASPLKTFWLVTLPLLRPAILSAAFLAFLASFDDLVISLFLSGPAIRTLQIQMWQGIRFESDPTIAAVSTLMLVVSLVAFCVVQLRSERRGAKSAAH